MKKRYLSILAQVSQSMRAHAEKTGDVRAKAAADLADLVADPDLISKLIDSALTRIDNVHNVHTQEETNGDGI